MSLFYRICPHDAHTCADRTCLADQHLRCLLAEAPPTKPSTGVPLPLPVPVRPADDYACLPSYEEIWEAFTEKWQYIRTLRSFQWVLPRSTVTPPQSFLDGPPGIKELP